MNERRRGLRSGDEDGVRNGDVGTGIGGIGEGFWNMRCSRWRLGGTYVGIEGDGSGVNMPLSYRTLSTRVSESPELDTELERLSREELAPRQEVDVFGLGTGDEVGVRRGDGSGNSWSSSSSSIGETLGVSFDDRGSASSLFSLEPDASLTSWNSCECRLLSTSSTLNPSFAEKLETTSDGMMPANPESRLLLLLRLADLENFSRHSTPTFRLSSVICTQFSQQDLSGTVMTSVRGGIGRETLREVVGREGEVDFGRTRQGDRGWISGDRDGERGDLDKKLHVNEL